MVANEPAALNDGGLADALAARCLDDAIEVEAGMADGSSARGHGKPSDLHAAVREDFADFLTDTWPPGQ